ncbi:hypothetical protein SS37A_32890 [Methylocystis iwaonis]|uniref:Uncharacterized protein n=1 Tax=Methylocystis iwaonis TaxID=2885079 RepID=A0ABN6VJB2_9HYPH|nr:hypothetical protein SS37A_32890 [Methylocystis iwaonis]
MIFGEAEFCPDGPKLGTLTGLCPNCAGLMHRRTSIAKLHAATGDLKVSIKHAESRLGETHSSNCNPYFERG